MEDLEEIKKLFKKHLSKLSSGKYRDLFLFLLRKIFALFPPNGIKVIEQEWDYLIILDACRYDAFKLLNNIPGKLEKKISQGSSTEEWLRRNFQEYYEDTIYISGNPFVSNIEIKGFKAGKHFWKIVEVWRKGWKEDLKTTPPREVTRYALKVDREYPEKRKIIHYLQPHDPFIGKTKLIPKEDPLDLWKHPKVKKAWMDNLRLIMSEVKQLIKELEGNIIISSDHGDCFRNTFFLYRHPYGIYIKELVEIPWFHTELNKN